MALSQEELNKKYGISDEQWKSEQEFMRKEAERKSKMSVDQLLNEKYGITGSTPAPTTKTESLVRGAGQGLTLGLSPYLQGLGLSASQWLAGKTIPGQEGNSQPYSKNVEDARNLEVAAQTSNPWIYGGGNLVGAVPSYLLGGAALKTIAPTLSAFKSGAILNTAGGAIAGASEPTGGDLNARLMNTAVGGGLGLGLGAIVHGAGYGTGKVVNSLREVAHSLSGDAAFAKTANQALDLYGKAHTNTMGIIQNELEKAKAIDLSTKTPAVIKSTNEKIKTLQSIVDNAPDANSAATPGTYNLTPAAEVKYQDTLKKQVAAITKNRDFSTQSTPVTPAQIHQHVIDNFVPTSQIPDQYLTYGGGVIGAAGGSLGGMIGGAAGAAGGALAGHTVGNQVNKVLSNRTLAQLNKLGNVGDYFGPELEQKLGRAVRPDVNYNVNTPVAEQNLIPNPELQNWVSPIIPNKSKFATLPAQLTPSEIRAQQEAARLAAANRVPLTPEQEAAKAQAEAWLLLGKSPEEIRAIEWQKAHGGQWTPDNSTINQMLVDPAQHLPVTDVPAVLRSGRPVAVTPQQQAEEAAWNLAREQEIAAKAAANRVPLTPEQETAKAQAEAWQLANATPEEKLAIEWQKAHGGQWTPNNATIDNFMNGTPGPRPIPMIPRQPTSPIPSQVGPDYRNVNDFKMFNPSSYNGGYGIPGAAINTSIQQATPGSRLRALLDEMNNGKQQ